MHESYLIILHFETIMRRLSFYTVKFIKVVTDWPTASTTSKDTAYWFCSHQYQKKVSCVIERKTAAPF